MTDATRAAAETLVLKNFAHLLKNKGIGAFDAYDLIIIAAKSLDAHAAERTAALRTALLDANLTLLNQTAALRALVKEHGRHEEGCSASPLPTHWRQGDGGLCNCWMSRALLADPEGQRAGEETQALERERDTFERALREGCCLVAVHVCPQANTLAAVERARQP